MKEASSENNGWEINGANELPVTPITTLELKILGLLKEMKQARAVDIARRGGLNQKSVWQALQRLKSKGLVEVNEFNVYTITERGLNLFQAFSKVVPEVYVVAEMNLRKILELIKNRSVSVDAVNSLNLAVERFLQEIRSK